MPRAGDTYPVEADETPSAEADGIAKMSTSSNAKSPAKSHETSSGDKSLPEAEGTYSGENHEASPANADESAEKKKTKRRKKRRPTTNEASSANADESVKKSISSRAKRMPRADDTYPVEADETPSDDAD
eukprot:TRINITY_DN4650_c0_g1_i5.p2 TRINITY_DN4650_c0_g1~~TRINITY_DN4650_c0_g1_i5.p2  ORF type:complete len:130 (+),score=19.79 TRINITY_DN4650_c0_g1_i5:588-977(+)